MWLSENLDTESGLISLLYQQDVLSLREKERILCTNDTYQRNEHLLGLLSKKSPRDFEHFLEALEVSGQGHLAEKLRNPAGITINCYSGKIKALYTYRVTSNNASNSMTYRESVFVFNVYKSDTGRQTATRLTCRVQSLRVILTKLRLRIIYA